MGNKIRKFSVLLALLTAVFCGAAFSQKQSAYRKLVFQDEFDKPANAPVDAVRWTAEIGGKGWGNQELQYYTNSIENAFHDGEGSLVIKAVKLDPPLTLDCWYGKCKYASARLITKQKFEQKYGRFEARIKIPRSQGMWSAFWMLGNDIDRVGWAECGEIDIMENIGREPSKVYGTIHGPGYSGAKGIGKAYSSADDRAFADDFHVYAVEWSKNKIEWFVDGKSYQTLTPKNLPKDARWVYDHPFFLILNLAVGGPWGGEPDETTIFPGVMMIDYVRVYKR